MNPERDIPLFWHPLALPGDNSPERLQQVVQVCSAVLNLRVATHAEGQCCLEVSHTASADHQGAEAIVKQALADTLLRERIASKANREVAMLAADILTQAGPR